MTGDGFRVNREAGQPDGVYTAMKYHVIPALFGAALVAGCSGGNPLTTSALMGGNSAKAPEPAVQTQNDAVSRAMQVGTTSARALKCGFNIDPGKLRGQFIAAETTASPADVVKVTQVYDTAYRGVSRAVASQGEMYCSERKVAQIKEALTRHLAGDYSPSPPEPEPEDEGLFGNLGSGSTGGTEGMSKFQKPLSEW